MAVIIEDTRKFAEKLIRWAEETHSYFGQESGNEDRSGMIRAALTRLKRHLMDVPADAQDASLKPIIQALAGVKDISHISEVAEALVKVELPKISKPKKIPENPFTAFAFTPQDP
jgi:hypothetical protein